MSEVAKQFMEQLKSGNTLDAMKTIKTSLDESSASHKEQAKLVIAESYGLLREEEEEQEEEESEEAKKAKEENDKEKNTNKGE